MGDDIYHWQAAICGAEGTPYAGGLFQVRVTKLAVRVLTPHSLQLDIVLPVNYPFKVSSPADAHACVCFIFLCRVSSLFLFLAGACVRVRVCSHGEHARRVPPHSDISGSESAVFDLACCVSDVAPFSRPRSSSRPRSTTPTWMATATSASTVTRFLCVRFSFLLAHRLFFSSQRPVVAGAYHFQGDAVDSDVFGQSGTQVVFGARDRRNICARS
jgi:hypothetical protein